MLQVDLRELSGGPATTQAELGAADPLFEGLGLVLAGPVRVTGRLHAAGEGRFYWQASLRAQESLPVESSLSAACNRPGRGESPGRAGFPRAPGGGEWRRCP